MKSIVYYLLLFFVIVSQYSAQVTISDVAIKFGEVRNFQDDWSNADFERYTFSPEVEIGGKFLTSYMQWGLSISYWDDGINKPLAIADHITISHTNYAFGLRVIFTPNIFMYFSDKMSISLVTGLSYNIRKGKNLSFQDMPQSTENFFQPYLGFRICFEICNRFDVLGEAGSHIKVDADKQSRFGFSFGGRYRFNQID